MDVGGVGALPVATQTLLQPSVVAGICVMAAVIAVIMSLATFLGIRIFRKRRQATQAKSTQADTGTIASNASSVL